MDHTYVLRDLVPFVQFWKLEKQPRLLACNFAKSNTPPSVFCTFFKLYKWYQMVQHITYTYEYHFGISSLQNWLNHSFSSTSVKYHETKKKKKKRFGRFFQNVHFWGCIFLVPIQSSQFFSGRFFYKIHGFVDAFILLATIALITEKLSFSCFHGKHC